MSDIGKLKIEPSEAMAKANRIRSYANRIDELFKEIAEAMNMIDDENEGIYSGTKKANELRNEFDTIKTNFEPIYNQIKAFASEIDAVANAAANQ